MLVPFHEFPIVPPVVAGIVPPLSLAIRLPRVVYYFGYTEMTKGAEVRERYERAYVIEWSYAIASALGLDVTIFRRVWICDNGCIGFLRQVLGFPNFFMDYVVHGGANVSFLTLVEVIETYLARSS